MEHFYAIAPSSREGKAAGHLIETYRETEQVKYFSKIISLQISFTNSYIHIIGP